MGSSVLKSGLIISFILLIIVSLMVLEMNQLAPMYKQTSQLVMYSMTTFLAIFTSAMVSALLFYKNKKNPKTTAKKSRLTGAFYTVGMAALIFLLPNLLLQKSAASCIKPNIYAVIADPLNIQVCMNIKSILITKLLPFTTPLFLPNLIFSTLIVVTIAVLLYLLVTAKFLYSTKR